ncbi:MAG: thiamine phosphate synthase, partial [Myxococcales bacterium]|nr:thiamine phosphate synthase [Myxococcales bacterium]
VLERIAPECRAAGVPLVVNDDVEAALAGIPGVSGVHLGQDDPGARELAGLRSRGRMWVGLSSHNPAQLRAAIEQAPDYVAFGPVLATQSKANPDPTVGMAGLADACRISRLPLVAIGGLDAHTGAQAIANGAAMVAMISALVDDEPDAIARRRVALVEAFATAAAVLDVDEVQRRIPVLSRETLVEIARWADDLAVLAGLRLPARFSPSWRDGEVHYRPSDVADLLWALGKQPGESWAQWSARGDLDGSETLVRLRR